MEAYIEYINSFIPGHQKKTPVFHQNSFMLLGKATAYHGGSHVNTRQCFHIVIHSSDTPPPLTEGRKTLYFKKQHAVMLPPERDFVVGGEYCPCNAYRYLIVKKDVIEQIAKDYFGRPASLGILQSTVSPQILNLFSLLEMELANPKAGSEIVAKSMLSIFICSMLRSVTETHPSLEQTDGDGISLACAYIEEYYNSPIDIDDLARVANISKYHFMRQFKQATGRSPHSYLKQIRLQKSCELLMDTDFTVSEVARMCGFLSASHFTSEFKKLYLVTPSHARKQRKQHFFDTP